MKCMNTAFIASCASFIAAIGLSATIDAVPVLALVWLVPAGLTALWIGHAWMFTLRTLRSRPSQMLSYVEPEMAVKPVNVTTWTRRKFLTSMIQVLAYSTALSTFPRGARADCNCYLHSDCYCPDDFPKCVFNPITKEAICCGERATGCAGQELTWCCADPEPNCWGGQPEGFCY